MNILKNFCGHLALGSIVILVFICSPGNLFAEKKNVSFVPAFLKPGNIFIAGEQITLPIHVTGLPKKPDGYSLSYRILDFWGKEIKPGQNLNLTPARKYCAANISFQLDTPGWYRGEISLVHGDELIVTANKNLPGQEPFVPFVILAKAKIEGRKNEFPFGVCEHYLNDKNARLLELAGIGWLRTDVFWEDIEKEEGRYRWDRLDGLVRLATKFNIHLLAIIDYGVPWASTAPESVSAFEKTRFCPLTFAYQNFLNKLLTRYKEKIKFWEVWNEPNIALFWKSSREEYADLLKIAHTEIKKIDPAARVLMGGTAGTPVDWVKMLEKKQAAGDFDIFNVHPYHYPQIPEKRLPKELNSFEESARALGKKPLWVTEVGAPTNLVSLEEQAAFLVRDAVLALSTGVEKFFWYELADDHMDANDREANFGILFSDLSPKPAYAAYANLTRLLGGMKFQSKLELGSDENYGFLFKGKEEEILVLWTTQQETQVTLKMAAPFIKQIDIMGREDVLAVNDGAISLTLTSYPLYILKERN